MRQRGDASIRLECLGILLLRSGSRHCPRLPESNDKSPSFKIESQKFRSITRKQNPKDIQNRENQMQSMQATIKEKPFPKLRKGDVSTPLSQNQL